MQQLQSDIGAQRDQLDALVRELELERHRRRNRQEYDALAGAVLQLPDRKDQSE